VLATLPDTNTESLSKSELQSELVKALGQHLPMHCLLWNNEDTTPYECDGLTAYRQRPLVVALPETNAQVQAVLRTCHALKVPVVARGAGTGLSGGALPHALGVTLSLAKFNKILKIDAVSTHGGGAVRCAQPGHQRGGSATACTTRPTQVQPDCLHHWRQRG
jgi:glycolate oxidase